MLAFLVSIAVLLSPTPGSKDWSAMAGSSDPGIRRRALDGIAKSPVDIRWEPIMFRGLTDTDPDVQVAALCAWFKHGKAIERRKGDKMIEDQEYTSQIRDKLNQWHADLVDRIYRLAISSGPFVSHQAIRTLSKLCDPVDVILPPVGRCGTGIENTLEYKAELRLKETFKSHPDRFQQLNSDADPDVALNVLSLKYPTLWKSHGHRVKGFLSNPDRRFRAIALWILAEAPPKTNLRLVAPLVDDPDEDLAMAAQLSLRLTPKEAMDIAKPAAGRSLKLRETAIQNLGWEPNPERDAMLVSLLSDSEPRIRIQAFNQLIDGSNEGSAKYVGIVSRMLDDPSPSVRATVLYKAVNLKLPNLYARVKSALTQENRELRQAALWSASSVDPNGDLTEEMVRAVELGVDANYYGSPAFDDPRFAHLIQKCLRSKVADVRQLLCFHYGTESARKDPAVMIQLARDPDPDVARIIIPALGSLEDDRAYGLLVELLDAKAESVRTAAMDGLAATGKSGALKILEKYLKDESRTIRAAAKYAIAELKEKVIPPR